MYLTLGLVIAVSMKTAGILFVFASMVIPPMTGLVLSRRVGLVFIVSILSVLLSVGAGLWISFTRDLHTRPIIICVEGALFFLALLFRKKK